MSLFKDDNKILAVLGPTNTGKTYLAFDRLLSYKSGIFGFPLRLLARENYDKAVKIKGLDKVALVTGEEKIIPKNATYYFCTVESMPANLEVECVAIDEIQLASDYERGHIFTDRILNHRGSLETIFLGSLTIKNILIKLFPKINIQTRERFSKLSFVNKQNLSKLKPRSAVIAFNINKVYEIAESMRQYKGGAAVVLGSLSPRTRNAQVEVYENKKVDYLVATDAIGMGLNLGINHVTFSSLQKFDGRHNRNLFPSEIGQIAGRAGRYQNDGTFSYTKDAGNIDPIIINSIENSNFDILQRIYWRNQDIDFSTIESVKNSLNKFPVKSFFVHKKNAEDEINFRTLSNDNEISKFLVNETAIKLLWDVCRIPDFQKIMNDTYQELLKNIYLKLINNGLKIPESWLGDRIEHLDNYSGGIEELTSKIANIRTWTYISNQSNWLENTDYWKDKTRLIEDNLSDHLHESLTNRFIDFSASVFVSSKNQGEEASIKIHDDKSVKFNGQNYGYINGFELRLDKKTDKNSIFSLNHVKKSIRSMMQDKVNNFIDAPNDSINLGQVQKLNLNDKTCLFWGDESVGYLIKGDNIFSPKVKVLNSEFLESEKKIQVNNKLQKWIDDKISDVLKPIKNNLDDSASSSTRTIAFNLFNNLGTMPVEDYKIQIKNFNQENKTIISKLGIRIGAKYFFIPNFLKKNALELKAILWKVFNDYNSSEKYPLPNDGRVSMTTEIDIPTSYWLAIGYICINNFAVRVDVFERIFFLARQKLKFGPFLESSDLMNPIGCNSNQLAELLDFCGFQNITLDEEKKIFFVNQTNAKQTKSIKNTKNTKKSIKIKNKNKSKKISTTNKNIKPDPNSPFAVLEKLL